MDAPFDRGEVDRASLDATERLRARLAGRPAASAPLRGSSKLPWVVAAMLFVFTAGMIANPWFEDAVRGKLPFVRSAALAPATVPVEVAALKSRLAQLETRSGPGAAAAPSERMARTEAQLENSTDQIARDSGRIDRLASEVAALSATIAADRARGETAASTAIAAADRAHAMLTLVLVRRSIDSGRSLIGLETALRQSFGGRYPEAVKSVLALGAAPVTLVMLRRDFNALRPAIGAAPATGGRQSWWETLTSTIGTAVSRPAGDAPLTPADAATAALARGDVQAAANYVRRVPPPRAAGLANWIAAADRLQAGSAALATLETAAVLTPPVLVAVMPTAMPVPASTVAAPEPRSTTPAE